MNERWIVLEGDCLEIMPSLGDRTVQHVVTDPPYSEHVHAKPWQSKALSAAGDARAASAHAGLGFEALTSSVRAAVARECARLAERWTLAFCDFEGLSGWQAELTGAGLDWVRVCVWDKVDSAPQFTGDRPANGAEAIAVSHQRGRKRWNGGGKRNVYRHATNAERGPKPHPSTKPLPLMLEILGDFTDPDDVILDPFCGSGSTGAAAIQLGRRFIGIERNPEWVAVARERLEAASRGQKLQTYRAGQISLFSAGGKCRS